MKTIQYFFILSIVIVLLGCTKDEKQDILPSAITKEYRLLPSGGIELFGDFQGFGPDDEVGINVFDENSFLHCIATIEQPIVGKNSVKIERGLNLDEKYEYNAYIKTSTKTYFGLEESFISNGSAPITITGITPSSGVFLEDVTLSVQEIGLKSASAGDIEISFNGALSQGRIENGNITTSVPRLNEGSHILEIIVDFYGTEIPITHTFALVPPVIEQVTQTFAIGEEITITGQYFEPNFGGATKVLFDGHEGQITSNTDTEIKVIVPEEVTSLNPEIKVYSQLQETAWNSAVTTKTPKINEYPLEGKIFDEITIYGENFHPVHYMNKVFFDEAEGHVIGGDTERLTVRVPTGPYKDWNPNIKVLISEELTSDEYPFTIDEYSIEINDNVNIPINGFQLINNEVYVYGFGIYISDELVIHKYSELDNVFYDKKIVSLPVGDAHKIITTDDGYAYLFYQRETNNFFRVNIGAATFEQLEDFPDTKRLPSLVAINNGNIIVGNGTNSYREVYSYSIAGNSWLRINDSPNPPVHKSFYSSDDNKSYFLQGVYSVVRDIYEFDGTDYVLSAIDLPSGYKDLITRDYFYKNDTFYFIEDTTGWNPNGMITMNTNTGEWTEAPRVLPKGYPVLGIFHKNNNVYLQVIDSQYVYRLFKVDLSKIKP